MTDPVALQDEVRAFFQEWFVAIKRHDRQWVDAHLSPEFSDWIVPSGKALMRADFLDVEMAMEEFDAEFVDLRVEQTGGFVVALYTLVMREQFPDRDAVDDATRSTMDDAGVYGVVSDTWREPRATVINTVFRRGEDGRLLVVHHMLVGLAEEPAPAA